VSFTGIRFMVGSISDGPKYSSKAHGLRLYPRQRSGLFLPVHGGSLIFVITMGSHISKNKIRIKEQLVPSVSKSSKNHWVS